MTTMQPNAARSAASSSHALPDVQGASDHRRIAIDRVGVRGIRHPIAVRSAQGTLQPTVAEFAMYVSLEASRKGTHMSRFLEVLGEFSEDLSPGRARAMCRALRERLGAERAFLEIDFPFFLAKAAPVTGKAGLMDFPVRYELHDDALGGAFTLGVRASATSLCPCSKEISEFGAHNQRCEISAFIRSSIAYPIEALIEHLEASASCAVYPVLKRPDEKFVTEEAFRNPKFVEDIVRDLAQRLDGDQRVDWFRISSENFESIHGHNAFAEIERTRS